MSILKPLVWHETKDSFIDGRMELSAQGAGIFYTMRQMQGYIQIDWHNQVKGSYDKNVSYKSFNEAQKFITKKHYPHFMSEFVADDTITDIRNWFKAAKPEPTHDDVIAQMACHFEEVDEMIDSTNINLFINHLYEVRRNCKQIRDNNLSSDCISKFDNLELLDALCDQIVTATGVAYMMGFDIEGALKEVIRSNNSKMVDGKFEFDDNGKIMKAEGYSPPNLKPFLASHSKNSDLE